MRPPRLLEKNGAPAPRRKPKGSREAARAAAKLPGGMPERPDVKGPLPLPSPPTPPCHSCPHHERPSLEPSSGSRLRSQAQVLASKSGESRWGSKSEAAPRDSFGSRGFPWDLPACSSWRIEGPQRALARSCVGETVKGRGSGIGGEEAATRGWVGACCGLPPPVSHSERDCDAIH